MKAIAVLVVVLMVMPAVMAVEVGDRVTVYKDSESPIVNHEGYFDVASTNINEVAVCTGKDKSKGYVVASVKSKDLIGNAIAVAKSLYSIMSTSQFDHFGCVRVRV